MIVLAHWCEHLAQAFEVYVLGWPVGEARGLLGMPFPWLVSSESIHYVYALGTLVGLWVLRLGFVGRAYQWWVAAFWIQVWVHLEHALLAYQGLAGRNFFGSPAPISFLQMVVPRLEVQLLYDAVVTIPMVVALYYHFFPSPDEAALMICTCGSRASAKGQADKSAQGVPRGSA
jgi:hypothetical protein